MAELFYTGVGSRDISEEEWALMVGIGKWLSNLGFKLRSGKAEGSDSAFETGVQESENPTNKEIYVPWENFKGNQIPGDVIVLAKPDTMNYAISVQWIKDVHPAYEKLKQGARKLHQRNVHQVLGRDLENPAPSCFLLACANTDKHGDAKGGTATAWKIAKANNVPCLNIRGKTKQEIYDFLRPLVMREITSDS